MLNLDNPEPWVFDPGPGDPRRDAHALLVDYVNETLKTPPPNTFLGGDIDYMEPTRRRHAFGSTSADEYEMGRMLQVADEALRRDLVVAALEQDLAMMHAGYEFAPRALLCSLAVHKLLGEVGTRLERRDIADALRTLARDGEGLGRATGNWWGLLLNLTQNADVECKHPDIQEALLELARLHVGAGSDSVYGRLWDLQADPFRLDPREEWARRLWVDYLEATPEGQALWRDLLAHAEGVRRTPSRRWRSEAAALAGRVEGRPFAERFAGWLDGYVARTDEPAHGAPVLPGLTWIAAVVPSPPVDAITEVALGGYTKIIREENEFGIQQEWRSEATGSTALRALAYLGEAERLRHLQKAIPHKRAKGLIDRLLAGQKA